MKEILADSRYAGLSAKEKRTIIKNINDNLMNQNWGYNNLSGEEKAIQNQLSKDYQKLFNGANHNTVSDIHGGATNLTIQGNYGHGDRNSNPQTEDTYWFTANGEIIRNPNKECFAGYFGRKMVGEPEHSKGLDSINQYLPNSSQSIQQMIEEMEKNIK